MGAIVSRITGAPYVPGGPAEGAAVCAITSAVVMALTQTPAVTTWQEGAASADITSAVTMALTNTPAIVWQEGAADAAITSGVTAALTKTPANPLSIAALNSVSLASWHRSDLGVLPAGTLLQASGTLTPSVLLEGSIAAVKGLRVEVNDVSGGTASGQAKYRYSADGGATWIETGVTTSQTRRAMTGAMSGAFLTFPAGTYNASAVYNSVVDGWEDQTGNGHDFVAVDDVHTMLLESSGSYTGIPSLRTNGVDQWLQNMSLGPTLSGSDVAFTIWTVTHNMNTAQSGVMWNLGRSGQNSRSFHETQCSSSGTFNVNRDDDAAALKTRITPVGTNDGLRHRQCQTFSGTDVSVYQDGGSVLTLTSSADLNVGTITFTWFTLGCRYGTSPSTYQACRYNEVIVMAGVASAQMRADMESYFAARYV